ncbi:MAG: DUF4251 domain-containing protein [Bacteroidales bacterium]|nr:DUF4251 domain-containing protein [Bacteroidales bacterium]
MAALLLILLLPMVMDAQQNKGESKAEKKEREKQEQLAKYNFAKNLVLDSSYVIHFDRVLTRYGRMITGIRGELNYLHVEGDTAVLQFRTGHALWPGINGLGGITLKGVILNKKIIEKNGKNRIFITFTISGNLRNKISISLSGSNEAAVDIDHPQYGRAESLRGVVEPVGKIKLVEGGVF